MSWEGDEVFVVINPGTLYETLFYGQVASVYVRSAYTKPFTV